MNKKPVTKNNLEKEAIDMKESFSNLVRFIIQRFELNDSTKPSYYIVGFKLVCDINQREQYLETHVDFKSGDGKSENEICTIAYSDLKPKIESAILNLLEKKFIVGSEFVPPVK